MATQSQIEQSITDALNKSLLHGAGGDWRKREVQELLDTVADVVYRHLKKEPTAAVTLRGLGRFKINTRPPQKARMGRNPATGEEMKIKAKPASKRLKAFPAKALKDRLKVK